MACVGLVEKSSHKSLITHKVNFLFEMKKVRESRLLGTQLHNLKHQSSLSTNNSTMCAPSSSCSSWNQGEKWQKLLQIYDGIAEISQSEYAVTLFLDHHFLIRPLLLVHLYRWPKFFCHLESVIYGVELWSLANLYDYLGVLRKRLRDLEGCSRKSREGGRGSIRQAIT